MPEPSGDYPVKRPWTSLITVLAVQTQTAFNDNFLKFMLISLAGVVATGSFAGEYAEQIFASFIPIAFIIFSPIAGFLSDRYSKRNLLFWTIVAQILILGLTIFSLQIQSVILAMSCLFLLSIQSAFFSPAKQGILKELVGKERLATANGMMQMLTMLGILGGIGLGSKWFGLRQEAATNANPEAVPQELGWGSAMGPVLWISLIALPPLLMNFFVDKTPPQSRDSKFKASILWSHFGYISRIFKDRLLGRASISICFYWFIASFFGVFMVQFAKQRFDVNDGGAAQEQGKIGILFGAGIMIGSILVAILCRKGNRTIYSVFGAVGLSIGMALTSFFGFGNGSESSLGYTPPFYTGITMVGLFGAMYIVPLSSFFQEYAPNELRGRLLAANGVLTSLAGLAALGISLFLTSTAKLSASTQILLIIPPTIVMIWFVFRFNQLNKSQESTTETA